jgi:hypothetical protein
MSEKTTETTADKTQKSPNIATLKQGLWNKY